MNTESMQPNYQAMVDFLDQMILRNKVIRYKFNMKSTLAHVLINGLDKDFINMYVILIRIIASHQACHVTHFLQDFVAVQSNSGNTSQT